MTSFSLPVNRGGVGEEYPFEFFLFRFVQKKVLKIWVCARVDSGKLSRIYLFLLALKGREGLHEIEFNDCVIEEFIVF